MPENCNPKDCPLAPRVEALEKADEQHSATHREIFKRLGEVEQDNAVQEVHYSNILEKVTSIEASIKELSERASGLEQKPGKRWNSTVDKVIWFVIEAVLIIAAVKVGLM